MSAASETTHRHAVSVAHHGGGVHVLTLHAPAGKPFILSAENLAALEHVLHEIEHKKEVRALVIRAEHPTVFCAGADIDALVEIHDSATAQRLSRRGQDLFNRLDDLHYPVIACIHGTCVGGGLELALACDVRLASDHSETRLGFPEVQLGILPAWGGTSRLPEIAGLPTSLDLLVTGRMLDGRTAARLGLVKACVPHGLLLDYGLKEAQERIFAHEHGDHGGGSSRSISVLDYFAENTKWGKRVVFSQARRRVLAKTHGHLPAPLEIIDAVERSYQLSRDVALWREREAVGRLVETAQARHLSAVFARNRDKYRGKPYNIAAFDAGDIRRVAVIGAGVMGAGIAALMIEHELDVRLIDPYPEALARARVMIEKELSDRRGASKATPFSVGRMMSRLTVSAEFTGLGAQDLILEAIPEIADLKYETLRKVAAAAPAGALITTNTSSLPLKDMEPHVRHPERFAGLHFFNPPRRMPLIEIVHSTSTSEETLARLVHFARRLGKTPVVVADQPAFVVNRLLAPYLLGALHLVHEGDDVKIIDSAMRDFGFPMGPFELMDTIGLDVVQHVCRYLSTIPARRIKLDPVIDRLVARKRLGRKSGMGFYDWSEGKPRVYLFDDVVESHDRPIPVAVGRLGAERIARRLSDLLVHEANQILADGGVLSADDLDLASIYGMGFPAWRGGIATFGRERTDV